VVENRRVAGGRVVQRHVLYLGEINSSQELAWRKSIEVGSGAARSKRRGAARRRRDGTEEETVFLVQQLVVSGHLAPRPPVHPPPGWMRVNSALVEAGIREQRQRAGSPRRPADGVGELRRDRERDGSRADG
jgi:hypothetical protein